MQILTEHVLKWDTKTKTSTGKEILGTVRAFAGTDEEQGKKTLHRPWQMWMEEINQTLRNALFDNDNKTRNKARQTFQQHIDNVVSTSYGPQFFITHKCIGEKDKETLKTGIPEVYSKRKNLIVYVKQGTKTYAMTLKGASCSVKTMSNPYPPQIL